MTVEEIKSKISTLEKGLTNPQISEAIKEGMKKGIEKFKKDLEALEGKAEVKVEKADEKVEEAKEKVEEAKKEGDTSAVKEAKEELKEAVEEKKDAVEEVKEVQEVAKKVEKVEKKWGGKRPNVGRKKIDRIEKPKGQRGGKREGAGRKAVASSSTKMVAPKGYIKSKNTPVFIKRKVVKKAKKAEVKKVEKMKSVRAFGQKVEYKNNADFCSKLISAYKKRKAVSKKLGKKRTRPVFGIISSKVADAVSKAIDNTSKKTIEANPKAFLAKAQRLEKSAIRFLEDFKAILGSDYKKSEISSEFGDVEKSIKNIVRSVSKSK